MFNFTCETDRICPVSQFDDFRFNDVPHGMVVVLPQVMVQDDVADNFGNHEESSNHSGQANDQFHLEVLIGECLISYLLLKRNPKY